VCNWTVFASHAEDGSSKWLMQESPADAKVTRDSSARMKAPMVEI